jgi:chromosome segregation ATPase
MAYVKKSIRSKKKMKTHKTQMWGGGKFKQNTSKSKSKPSISEPSISEPLKRKLEQNPERLSDNFNTGLVPLSNELSILNTGNAVRKFLKTMQKKSNSNSNGSLLSAIVSTKSKTKEELNKEEEIKGLNEKLEELQSEKEELEREIVQKQQQIDSLNSDLSYTKRLKIQLTRISGYKTEEDLLKEKLAELVKKFEIKSNQIKDQLEYIQLRTNHKGKFLI